MSEFPELRTVYGLKQTDREMHCIFLNLADFNTYLNKGMSIFSSGCLESMALFYRETFVQVHLNKNIKRLIWWIV